MKFDRLLAVLFCASLFSNCKATTDEPACESEIYCYGPLLDAAQEALIYNDSKSFVDMKLNYPPETVLNEFYKFNESTGGDFTSDQVKQFVNDYFSPPESELQKWTPNDWTNLDFKNIKDPKLQSWARDLNEFWKELGRKVIDEVTTNSSLFSLIPINNPVIVPGGRFREFYYWDTYWILEGLLLCEMDATVKGMISNFLEMVKEFGFIPNGGRIYYSKRSQPPFLIPMFDLYLKTTDDIEFLQNSIETLETEYNFWMNNRSVEMGSFTLNFYSSDVNLPRPESYREDKSEIKDLTPEAGFELMTHLTSACESGWDFSSRWAGIHYDEHSKVTSQLKTRDIVPVDLNSILAWNEKTLAKFHRLLGNEAKALEYDEKHETRSSAMEQFLWNEEDGIYYDYQISAGRQNKKYFASNLNPLWTKCYPDEIDVEARENKMLSYMQNAGILEHPGGVPTSLEDSGEQWDFPNAWPPLVHMIIEGMRSSNVPTLQDEAFKQAQKWVNGNYKAYSKTNAMFEKYNVSTSEGVPGTGGEYDVQLGFGWTNGVILSLLDQYGDRLTVDDAVSTDAPNLDTTTNKASQVVMHPFLIILLLALLCFV